MGDDKRVDDLREDLQELRREMHEGFNQLESRSKDANSNLIDKNKTTRDAANMKLDHFMASIDKELNDVNCKLDEHDNEIVKIKSSLVDRFNELDKKLFKLFF